MQSNKLLTHVNYYHKDADALIARRAPEIEQSIETFAKDLANQSRPYETDSQMLYMPKIKSYYEVLLEAVFKLIGALAVLTQTADQIKASYERETTALKQKLEKLEQSARILRKDIKGLTDISHIIFKWQLWRTVLIALSIGEVGINLKVFLAITPNVLTSIVASLSMCGFLFITAHNFKDILSYFHTRPLKWAVGFGIVLLVTVLLYNLNAIRLSYMQNAGEDTSRLSEGSFIALNLGIWIGSLIVAVIYKPLKSDIAKNVQFKKVKKELKGFEKEIKTITDRLSDIPVEQDEKLLELSNMKQMVHNYQNVIESHYRLGVALFQSENLFRRTDKVSPKCFMQPPLKLKNYF